MHDASRAKGVAAVTPSDADAAAVAAMAVCITIDGNDTSLFRLPTCRGKRNNILFTEGISKPLKRKKHITGYGPRGRKYIMRDPI